MLACHGVLTPSVTYIHRNVRACHLRTTCEILCRQLSAIMSPFISFEGLEWAPLMCHLPLDPHIRKKVRCLVGVASYMTERDHRMGLDQAT